MSVRVETDAEMARRLHAEEMGVAPLAMPSPTTTSAMGAVIADPSDIPRAAVIIAPIDSGPGRGGVAFGDEIDASALRMVAAMRLTRIVRSLAAIDTIVALLWAVFLQQEFGGNTWMVGFVAILPIVGAIGASQFRPTMVKAYMVYLLISIVGRVVMTFEMEPYLLMLSLLVVVLDVYMLRITFITARVLDVCGSEERAEMRLASSQGRLPMPVASGTGERQLLRI